MMSEITAQTEALQHPDSIWTWPGKSGRVMLWLPYLFRVAKADGGRFLWHFVYQGGEVTVDLRKADTLMFYGDSEAELPMALLDHANECDVIMVFHRRNKPRPIWLWPQGSLDRHDMLTRQIICRENGIRRLYVARACIHARLSSMQWCMPLPGHVFRELAGCRTLAGVRQLEAVRTKGYWDTYFGRLGLAGESRRQSGDTQAALDACSVFLAGILLRWVLFHRLSPAHGFLHEPTGYPALVYDLMEPYRWWFELAVANAIGQGGAKEQKTLVAHSINELKAILQATVWLPQFQVEARRKNVLHAAVLGLRSYLLGETKRLVLPQEGDRIGGRPVKAAFAVPGATRRR